MRDRAAPAGGVAASGIYATGLTGGPSPLSGCGWECRSAVPPPRGNQRPPTPRALVHHQEVSAYLDMIVKLRRVLIATQYQPEAAHQPTPDEIRAVRLAWAQVAA